MLENSDDLIDINDIKSIDLVDDQPAMDGWDEVDPETGSIGYYTDPEGEVHNITLEDPKALGLANNSLTDGVFQFDTPLAKQILQNGVKRFEDLLFFSAAGHPGPMQCCWSHSMVNTEKGYKLIKDLIPGVDRIACLSTEGDLIHTDLFKVVNSGNKKLIALRLSDGSDIRVSPDHKILTDEGYVRAEDITLKHKLISVS